MRFYAVLNFSYGNGPYISALKTALALNGELEKRGIDRCGIIIPLVYGERQIKICREEFGKEIEKNPDEFVFDEKLGALLKSCFYGEKTYIESTAFLIENGRRLSEEINKYLSGEILGKTIKGEKINISGSNIVMEIARSPRLSFGINRAYSTSFGHTSLILKHALEEEVPGLDRKTLSSAIPYFESVEKNYRHFIGFPGTFSFQDYSKTHVKKHDKKYEKKYTKKYKREEETPPHADAPPINTDTIEEGIYITVSGITGLKNRFKDLDKVFSKIYTNDTEALGFGEKKLPEILSNKKIRFHFARSGWGSVWLSELAMKPFVTFPYESGDDPEIYFNNRTIEKLGIGFVYEGQTLEALNRYEKDFYLNVGVLNARIQQKYGTLDGFSYIAEKIAAEH